MGRPRTASITPISCDPSAPRLGAPIVRLLDQFDAEYTFIGNRGTVFYLLTTLGAPRGRVVAIDVASPARERWATPVPESEDSIEEAAVVGGRLVALTQHDVQSHLAVYAADGSSRREIALPGIGSVSGLAGRADDPELYYGFSSFLIPPSVRWENVDSRPGGRVPEAADALRRRPLTRRGRSSTRRATEPGSLSSLQPGWA